MKAYVSVSILFLMICNFSIAQKDILVEYNPTNKLKLYYVDYYIEFEFAVEEKVEISVREGLFYYWYKEKRINSTQGGYDGKLLNGVFTVFYRSGQLKEKGNFNYGLKDGKWKQWHENGNLLQVSNWEVGLLNGRWIEYQENGLVVKEANYSDGQLDGDYRVYKNGELIQKKKYRKGKEVRDRTMKQKNDSIHGQDEVGDNEIQQKTNKK